MPVAAADLPPDSTISARVCGGARTELAATVRDLAAEGTTIVVATHDEEFARGCVDRVLMMEDGRIVQEGRTGDLLS